MVPNTKITAGGIMGAVVVLIVWLAGLSNIEVPGEVASALAVVLFGVVGWLVPETRDET